MTKKTAHVGLWALKNTSKRSWYKLGGRRFWYFFNFKNVKKAEIPSHKSCKKENDHFQKKKSGAAIVAMNSAYLTSGSLADSEHLWKKSPRLVYGLTQVDIGHLK